VKRKDFKGLVETGFGSYKPGWRGSSERVTISSLEEFSYFNFLWIHRRGRRKAYAYVVFPLGMVLVAGEVEL
jgi:hypothetical protein